MRCHMFRIPKMFFAARFSDPKFNLSIQTIEAFLDKNQAFLMCLAKHVLFLTIFSLTRQQPCAWSTLTRPQWTLRTRE